MSSAVRYRVQQVQLTAGPQMIETGGGPSRDDLCPFVICRIGQDGFAAGVLSVQENR